MSRFYVRPESVKGKAIYIEGKEAHHILDVMRVRPSDIVVAFDGSGTEYTGIVRETAKNSLVVEITKKTPPQTEKGLSTVLIQAIPKKEKMDYVVEKATELGVDALIPVVTKRTVVRWDAKKSSGRVERWRKIALEASKQSGRLDLPAINSIMSFEAAIDSAADCDIKLIAALSDEAAAFKKAVSHKETVRKAAVAIGPEGDFTPDEVKLATDAGFKLINLGARVLKSDTAGLFALSVLNYEYGK